MSAPFGPEYGFGLYTHWPYCTRICPYCDFNVYAAKSRDVAPLIEAICADIAAHGRRFADHPPLDTIYFGGGTPSLLSAVDIERIVSAADSAFGVSPGAEITLEANPNDALRGDLPGWRAAGVTRLSLGLQSLRDDALRFLGRDHDAASAIEATERVLPVFDSVSIDLIYARPDQSLEAWLEELGETLKLGAPHVSLYELTIEERTAFGKRAARGELVPMEDDAQADLYEATDAAMAQAGLPAYEVSNYACAPAHQSRHNLIYWRGGDWIGVGPGAHGRLSENGQRLASETPRRPADYVAADSARARFETLSPIEAARELWAMGLRPVEGVEQSRIETLAGAPLHAGTLAEFATGGFLRNADGRIALTAAGRLLADRIAAALTP